MRGVPLPLDGLYCPNTLNLLHQDLIMLIVNYTHFSTFLICTHIAAKLSQNYTHIPVCMESGAEIVKYLALIFSALMNMDD